MATKIPNDLEPENSIADVLEHQILGKVGQQAENLREVVPEELKLRLEYLIQAAEEAGDTLGLVQKWLGRCPWSVLQMIPFRFLLDAEANDRVRREKES